MRSKHLVASLLTASVMLLCLLPWRVFAQTPAMSPSGAAVPQPGAPNAPPQENSSDWNLSDLLDGIVKMEATMPLSHEQVAKIRPALQRVLAATKSMTASEAKIKAVLTPQQVQFISDKQQSGQLSLDVGAGAPRKPGEDPLVVRVLEILESRAK